MNTKQQAQATAVNELAASTARADAGNDRVFIAEAWDTLVASGEADGMTLAEFKALCVELQRAGLVRLTRCELVRAYGEERVARSECQRMGAAFHFIAV